MVLEVDLVVDMDWGVVQKDPSAAFDLMEGQAVFRVANVEIAEIAAAGVEQVGKGGKESLLRLDYLVDIDCQNIAAGYEQMWA
jgi:hypothetical protein